MGIYLILVGLAVSCNILTNNFSVYYGYVYKLSFHKTLFSRITGYFKYNKLIFKRILFVVVAGNLILIK